MPVWDFSNPPFGKEICHHSKWDQITQVEESAGSAVGDISINQGGQAATQGVTGQTKINNLWRVWWLIPINISTQGCKVTDPGVMNIYWTKIKLRAAANQAIYLVIFH